MNKEFTHSFRLSTMSRARKWSSKRPALVKHYRLEKCQNFDWIQKVKRPSTTSAISGCSTPSLRNSSYLFSVQRSLICNRCWHSNTDTNRLFKLEMIHFYFFNFSLFLKVGENAVGLCVPRLLVPTGRRPSQRLQTSSYSRSELLWQPQVFCKLALKFIYDYKNWNRKKYQDDYVSGTPYWRRSWKPVGNKSRRWSTMSLPITVPLLIVTTSSPGEGPSKEWLVCAGIERRRSNRIYYL